jgi:hypothetical protein
VSDEELEYRPAGGGFMDRVGRETRSGLWRHCLSVDETGCLWVGECLFTEEEAVSDLIAYLKQWQQTGTLKPETQK